MACPTSARVRFGNRSPAGVRFGIRYPAGLRVGCPVVPVKPCYLLIGPAHEEVHVEVLADFRTPNFATKILQTKNPEIFECLLQEPPFLESAWYHLSNQPNPGRVGS